MQGSAVRQLASSVSLYTLARCAGGSVRLLAVLWIVRAVSPSTFGTLATLWVPMVVVQGICDLGLGTAALRLAPECKTTADRRSLFGTMVWARAAASLLVTAVVVAAHEPLALLMTGSSQNGRALLWLALARPLAAVFEGFVDELRARDAMSTVSGLVFLVTCLIQGLSVLFAVVLGQELKGLVWARIVGEAAAFSAGVALCWQVVRVKPSATHLRHLLGFGWPFGLLYLLAMLRGLDKPLIGALTSMKDVAAYELGTRLVGPVGLANIALGLVLEPFVYRHAESRAAPSLVDLYVRGYITVFATVAMALCVLAPEGVTLLAPAPYHGAIRALPPLVFATTCEGLLRAAGIGADLTKQTRVWALASVLTLAIGLPLAFVLVPRVGIAGAGFSWLVANTAATLLTYRVAREVSGIALPVGRGLSIVVAGAVLGTLAAWHPWPLPMRLALLALFGLSVRHLMRMRWSDLQVAGGGVGAPPTH